MLLIDTFHLRNGFKGEYENYIIHFFYIYLLKFLKKIKIYFANNILQPFWHFLKEVMAPEKN